MWETAIGIGMYGEGNREEEKKKVICVVHFNNSETVSFAYKKGEEISIANASIYKYVFFRLKRHHHRFPMLLTADTVFYQTCWVP